MESDSYHTTKIFFFDNKNKQKIYYIIKDDLFTKFLCIPEIFFSPSALFVLVVVHCTVFSFVIFTQSDQSAKVKQQLENKSEDKLPNQQSTENKTKKQPKSKENIILFLQKINK